MSAKHGKPVIGLLGGVGAGKSTVAAELVRLGCALVDADAIGHDLLKDPQVHARFRRQWGEEVLDAAGHIDRSAVARRVFDSPADLRRLNAITHPRIRRGIMEQLRRYQADPSVPAIVLDAALLLETDWYKLCTAMVFVSAPGELRRRRVASSRGWTGPAWIRRENSQKPLDIKAAKSEYVIENSSTLARLREQVRSVFRQIVHPAESPKDRAAKRF